MPKIGLLSDSHGRARTTRLAIQTLLDQSVEAIVHLGDIGSIEVIDELVVQETMTFFTPATLAVVTVIIAEAIWA